MNKRKTGMLIAFSALAILKRQALFLFWMEFLSMGGLWIIAAFIYMIWLLKGGRRALGCLTGYTLICLLLWFSNAFYLPYGMTHDYDDAQLIKLAETLIELAEENYTNEFDIGKICENAPEVMNAPSARVIAFAYPEIMDGFDLSGVFIPFTGKSYINRNEKAFLLPFVASHELSHSKGILNEGQANVDAFLYCMKSDKRSFRYSASVYALKLSINELKSKNEAEYIRLERMIPEYIRDHLNEISVLKSDTHCALKNYTDLISGLIYFQSITSQGVI